MKKRIVSLLLLICLLASAVFPLALPAAASEEEALAGENSITVQFRCADEEGWGYNGTLIAERILKKGVIFFETPSDTECCVKGLNPNDIIGWYHIQPDGTIIDASAYSGTYVTENLVFYPITKSSTFSLIDKKNIPVMASTSPHTVLAHRGGWTGGVYYGGTFHPLTSVSDDGIAVYSGNSTWTYGSMYYNDADSLSYVLSNNTSRVTGTRYTAVADGTVTLNFDTVKLLNGNGGDNAAAAAGTAPMVYMAITVNNKLVWPESAKNVSTDMVTTGFADAGWYSVAHSETDVAKGTYTVTIPNGSLMLDVNGGDEICFYFGKGTIKTIDFSPTVTYTEIDNTWSEVVTKLTAYSSNFFDSENKPIITPNGITYPGAWNLVGYSNNTTAIAERNTYLATGLNKKGSTVRWITISALSWNNVNFHYDSGEANWGNSYQYSVATNKGYAAGYRYTAEFSGTVNISLNKLMCACGSGSEPIPVNTQFAIFHNGAKIWPTGDAWCFPFGTDYTARSGVKTYKYLTNVAKLYNDEMPSFSVSLGDEIEFLFTRASENIYGGCANEVDATIEYSNITLKENEPPVPESDYSAGFFDEAHAPDAVATGGISYPGAWDLVAYKGTASIATRDTYIADNTTIGTAANPFAYVFPSAFGTEGYAQILFHYHQNTSWGDEYKYAVGVSKDHAGGFRYTAEYTGYVDISLNMLMNSGSGSEPKPADTQFAIFHNGVKIWPASDAWSFPFGADYTALSGTETYAFSTDVAALYNDDMPSKLFVSTGDEIEFLFTRASGDIYAGRANQLDARVSYTHVYKAVPSVSASLGTNLALNVVEDTTNNTIYDERTTMPYIDASSVKIELSHAMGENAVTSGSIYVNDKTRATVVGIYAKQMTEDIAYKVTATAILPDKTTKAVILKAGNISIADYLTALTTDETIDTTIRDLAIATLHYGAEAQTFFNYKADDLANAGISDSVSFTPAAPTDSYDQTMLEGQTYAFTSISLLLNDTVQIKLYIDAIDTPAADVDGLYLQMLGDRAKIALRHRTNDTTGERMSAVVSIPYSKFGETYTFRVCDADGNAVTGDITYNVSTYLARQGNLDVQKALATSLLTLGQAVDAYIAAYGLNIRSPQ